MSEEYQDVIGYTAIDSSTDPGYFLHLMDLARGVPALLAARAAILDSLRLRPGHRVLEVGCGLGIDALEFARVVGEHGEVVGIDLSEAMVTEAARRTAGIRLNVSYALGDVTKLDFPDGSFDACRAERVLCYVADFPGAVGEMARVTRSGGRVSVFDVDVDTFLVDHPDHDLAERVLDLFRDSFPSGRIGRRLPRALRQAGLVDVTVTGTAAFFAHHWLQALIGPQLDAARQRDEFTPAEVTAWWAGLAECERAGGVDASLTCYLVAGTKP